MFTVITITFNSSRHLMDAVQSVLSQSCPPDEYIIVDGGSTDGTLDMLKSIAETYPCVKYISEPDRGISDAFNKGLRMASGDWVGIINSDDLYAPDALATVARSIKENPGIELVHGDMQRIDEGGKPLFILKPADVEEAVWRQMPLNHPTVFVSRALYERVGGFDVDCQIAMDYDFILRSYLAGARFHYVESVLAHMRYGGASDDQLWKGLKEVWRISTRHGCSRWKATYWLGYRALLGWIKMFLRKSGLQSLLKLHPRFRSVQ